jgi:stage II sporulation SpoAA-like protein
LTRNKTLSSPHSNNIFILPITLYPFSKPVGDAKIGKRERHAGEWITSAQRSEAGGDASVISSGNLCSMPVTPGKGGKEKMIELLPESHGAVLGFQFIGEITDEDYREDFMPVLRRTIKNYGLIRLFIDISDIQSEDIGAMDDDVREDSRVLYIEREAIIGDADWEKRLNYVDHFFLFPNTDVRFFPVARRDEAWNWVSEGMQQKPKMRMAFH